MNKNKLLFFTINAWIIAFIAPLISNGMISLNSTLLSISLNAVAAVSSIVTVIIALSIYDRFGLESKFIERKVDKVLDVVDQLKGQVYSFESPNGTYLIRPSINQIDSLSDLPNYNDDKILKVVFNANDFIELNMKILSISRSYWFPSEIRNNLNFLELKATNNLDPDKVYIKLKSTNPADSISVINDITNLETFVADLRKLIFSISEWLKNNSGLDIDFNLEEPENYEDRNK